LAISLTPHHDIRYSMPLLPYLAVLGTGWIVHLPRAARLAAAVLLVLAVVANTLGSTFGVGGQVETQLVNSPSAVNPTSDRIVLYSSQGAFGVAGPQRDGDVPGLLRALQREGVRVIIWGGPHERGVANFSTEGLIPLAMIAGLEHSPETIPLGGHPGNAALVHLPVTVGAIPCTILGDGSGVWVLRGNPATGTRELYCPFPRPHYYPE
jgi:hypothetical protein